MCQNNKIRDYKLRRQNIRITYPVSVSVEHVRYEEDASCEAWDSSSALLFFLSLTLFGDVKNENHVFTFIGRYQKVNSTKKIRFQEQKFHHVSKARCFFAGVISVDTHFCVWMKNTLHKE